MKVSILNAEHYSWGNNCDGWHLANAADLGVIYERMPAQTSEVRHFHSRSKQFFFVLEGQAAMAVNGEETLLNKHEGIEILPGIPHKMMNNSGDDLVFIVVSAPNSHGDRTIVMGENP